MVDVVRTRIQKLKQIVWMGFWVWQMQSCFLTSLNEEDKLVNSVGNGVVE